MKLAIVGLTTIGLAAVAGTRASPRWPPMVVHEWGTITTRHAPDGTPRGRLNHVPDGDTLPAFVHRYDPASTANDPERSLIKTALVAGRPDVTMRLETPVMYFYPPQGMRSLPAFNVGVRFRGGVLNEFYPKAEASVAPDVGGPTRFAMFNRNWNGARLDSSVVGRLYWRDLTLADNTPLVGTTSHVWLAPRRVHSTGVRSGNEAERYLFYRGVAHLDAVMQTRLTAADVELLAPRDLDWMPSPAMTVRNVWLVDIQPNGNTAFHDCGAFTIQRNSPSRSLARMPLFAKDEYGSTKRAELRESMKHALTSAGLFEDEAEAMLSTWEGSYFRTPGLRLFYLVPNEWTNTFLPVGISIPHELTRVLVGRIDLQEGP
jgi:hypothetical protein